MAGVRPGFAGLCESVIQAMLHDTVSASAEGVRGGTIWVPPRCYPPEMPKMVMPASDQKVRRTT
jgi:hypothetical protein